MRFTLAALGLAAIATAHEISYGPPAVEADPVAPPHKNTTTVAPPPAVYTTEVVTSYETFCPSATSIEHNGVTYTVTEATTLTITNCPCTVTKPVYSSVVTACSTCNVPTAPTETPTTPVQPPAPHYPANNETVPAYHPPPTGTGAYTPPASTSPIVPGYTGAAAKASFGIAGVLAAAGFIAAL